MRFSCIFLTAFLLNGCSGAVVTPRPTPRPVLQHAYVDGPVLGFQLPLSAASVAAFQIAASNGVSDCVDSQGRLFVPDSRRSTNVFTQPISASSTPAFTLNSIVFADLNLDCAVDPVGNLYVTAAFSAGLFSGAVLSVFPVPVQAGSVDKFVNSVESCAKPDCFGTAYLTTDTAGDVFENPAGPNPCQIFELSPLASGNKQLAAFGDPTSCGGMKIGPDGNLYVSAGASINVYFPPFHDGQAKNRVIPMPFPGLGKMDFDANHNLIGVVSTNGGGFVLYLIPPPYTNVAFTVPVAERADSIAITQ